MLSGSELQTVGAATEKKLGYR